MAGETGFSVRESKFPLLLADGSRISIQFNNVDRSTPVTQCVVPKPWRAISWIYVYILLVHIALVATSLALLRNHGTTRLDDGSFSPAFESIRHETKSNYVVEGGHSIFSGPPSPENDHAWNLLIRPTLFSASLEEMKLAGESVEGSVELIEGGYLASTSVYHDLHCLRQLRLYVYQDSYYPNLTEPQINYLKGHLDHCIEAIRLSIMCTGDVSMFTFQWQDPPGEKPSTKTNSKRSCIMWDAFEDWSRKRMVPTAPRIKSGNRETLGSTL